jgi:acetolactate synthase-1/2/3 large subunit
VTPPFPCFQGAGAISRELLPLFYGRIGLFRNQPGDKVPAKADVVISVGYDPVEYGPDAENAGRRASIIHIDDYPCDSHVEDPLCVSAGDAGRRDEGGTQIVQGSRSRGAFGSETCP